MNIRILSLLLPLLLVACVQAPRAPEFSDSDVILDKLHLVTNARVGMAYIDPDTDFSRFNKLLLEPLDLSNTEIVQPSRSTATLSRGQWELTDADRERLQKAYREIFTRELQETDDYEVVDAPGPQVLRVTAAVTQLAPNAPHDDMQSRTVGRSRVYSEGAGSMAIAFGFSDSQSGEVLAVVKDARSGNPVWGQNNSVTNMQDVNLMFGHWARMVRARLDIAHGY